MKHVSMMAGTLVLAAVAASGPLHAGNRDGVHRSHGSDRSAVKDCTRYNGRWGYYGNPWCSAREQDAFDRHEARRLGAHRRR